MDDQERFAGETADVINRLEGMSVPDSDEDDLVYKATELLRQARDLAIER